VADDHRTAAGEHPQLLAGPDAVTVISGGTFVISDESLDVGPGPQGLIARDTRHLARLELRVGGLPAVHLATARMGPDAVRFHGYLASNGAPDPTVEVERTRRVVDGGMHDEIRLLSWAAEPADLVVTLRFGCDFADIFEVRRMGGAELVDGRAEARVLSGGEVEFRSGGLGTRLRLHPAPDAIEADGAEWRVRLERGAPLRLTAAARVAGISPEAADIGVYRRRATRPAATVAADPPDLSRACARSMADLASLTMRDLQDPRRRLIAAGIPWFVALFGRDSLIVSHQMRAFEPGQMLSTLRALAARQGRTVDPGSEEEPGKILHEVRLTERPWLGEGTAAGARPYYGSIDATPLFLMLLGEAWRWGCDRPALAALLPAARAALAWMRGHGDPDGDGLIEYAPRGARSLSNQAWKDSVDAVQHPDGTLAEGPIAMVEVQGYAVRARRELAAVLAGLGHDEEAADLLAEAERLADLVRRRYWIPGGGGRPGFFALALDGAKRPVASVASNMGHLLWCDVPTVEQAGQVARHLTSAAMASGWGLRTLSAEMAGFNPLSYHVGSVWPHDTAIACEGLRRYGLDEAALRLADDLAAASRAFDDALPELFGGHPRGDAAFPIPYPTACRPQAWAAGVPLALVPTLLGLEPRVPEGTIALNPVLPPSIRRLEVRDIPFPSGRLSVALEPGGVRLIAVPPGLAVELRPPAEPLGAQPGPGAVVASSGAAR
jgi:glycogen debranching enzyme